ncbi:MAG TPA: hypothetical protein VEI07_19115 [Planctomycetaceae bacterium]|nr:hypothetical protein [Planctomycetaceae bacterium]
MRGFDFVGVLAAPPGNFLVLKLLIFVGVTLALSILRKVAESREKAARANTVVKTPSAPPKADNPFRNEIEAFLEEVGKRRAAGDRPGRPDSERGPKELALPKTLPPPKIEAPRKPVALRPVASNDRAKPEPIKTVVLPSGPPARPGAEMASRKAPGSEDLGKQIRTHLAQYLDASRMTVQTQSDLGNSVERTVRQHMGDTVTAGVAQQDTAPASSEASLIAPLLRNPANVRSSIVINEILGPPRGLRRRR